jgi:hypothetical protein
MCKSCKNMQNNIPHIRDIRGFTLSLYVRGIPYPLYFVLKPISVIKTAYKENRKPRISRIPRTKKRISPLKS